MNETWQSPIFDAGQKRSRTAASGPVSADGGPIGQSRAGSPGPGHRHRQPHLVRKSNQGHWTIRVESPVKGSPPPGHTPVRTYRLPDRGRDRLTRPHATIAARVTSGDCENPGELLSSERDT